MTGDMREVVAVQRPEEAADETGQLVRTWINAAHARASIVPSGSREQTQGRQVRLVTTYTVVMYYRQDLLQEGGKWRLMWANNGGVILNIDSVFRLVEDRSLMQLGCVEST